MKNDLTSIDSLLHPTGDEESVAGRFAKKQGEIKDKEIEEETEAAAKAAGLPYINLVGFPISPEAIGLIPENEARALETVCFFYSGREFRIGCLEPGQIAEDALKAMEDRLFASGRIYLISKNSFDYALEAYKTLPKTKAYEGGVEISEESLEKFQEAISSYKSLGEKINEVNISEVVTLILATALKAKASDIHIEAEEKGVVVRIRIDGVLQEAALIARDRWKRIISRLKILAGAKINIEDKPQDGRFSILLKERKIDVRCSFLPTAFGESVVLRLLDPSAALLNLDSLGFRPEVLPILKREIAKPNGLILTTGPTGSGKTTTLYSVLNLLNRPENKIITLEDPIEYQLSGINQSQVDEKKGYTFSDGLRSILRQDPNIVMVGEIRDLETAEIAVQASLTGHLVLSTLHTNDAAGVIPRLIDLGVKPYFLVPSINAVIGQRLVRRLCPHCRAVQELSASEQEQVKKILAVISPKAGLKVPAELPPLYKAGAGCEHCNYTGYNGRLGIYELFTMDDNIKQLTVDKAPSFKILQQAIENGMITMLQDGVLKALDGETSLDEVYRVVGNFDYIDELYDIVISQTIGRGVHIRPEEYDQASKLSSDTAAIASYAQEISASNLIGLVMALAVIEDAGDVHIEPEDQDIMIRFRIDGVLHDVIKLPKTSYPPLLSEIKIVSGEATNVRRATFDGRFSVYLPDGKRIDCRVSIIAGGYGETIVIRLLSTNAINLDMKELGITSVAFSSLQEALKKTRGIIITTGPTGSGKTTTLYSMLNELNRPDVKIITVEDPIEYQLPGIMQTQIDEEHGYTFASAMRSILRQNPNIMMIGEIRDNETAKIAIEAASTGHLVLSTIHANSAAGAISRFAGLGLDRQSLANSIEFAIGQRLVRRLCPYCKKPINLSTEDAARVDEVFKSIKNPGLQIPENPTFYGPVGCDKCNHIGYKKRLGIYEAIKMTPEIQKLITTDGSTDYEIEQAAIAGGMVTMLQDGVLKAAAGETSLEEVFRVIE